MSAPAMRCYFGPFTRIPVYPCVACGQGRRARMLWRPPFYFWVWLFEGPRVGPFPPAARVCRQHTVDKKTRRESPHLARS